MATQYKDVELHSCTISRRGKAAKGTVQVQTFGKPILNDDGIAKEWDYSEFRKLYRESDVLDAIRNIGNSIEIMLRGADVFLKSEGIRSQGETSILISRILTEGLALDKEEAKNVAAAIVTTRSNMKKLGGDEDSIPSIDFLLEMRKKVVEKELKAGTRKPRLVKPEPEEPEESSDDDNDEENEE